MFRPENTQKMAIYVLLSVLCFDSVFSAVIEAVQNVEDDDDRDIYGNTELINGADEDIFRLDFFEFTTRKRYIWEDWTETPDDPDDYDDSGSSSYASYQILLVIGLIFGTLIFTAVFVYIINKLKGTDCCSGEPSASSYSSVSASAFTTVHRPPSRRAGVPAQVHRPPADLFNEMERNHGAVNFTGTTISFINSTYASSSLGRTEPGNAASEKPPDYSAVTLNDLVNPTRPAFPVVRKDKETPPPEYGKENPLFK